MVCETGVRHHTFGNILRYKITLFKRYLLAKERLCGILVHDVKSRVHGPENLTIIIHQRQLLTFAMLQGNVRYNGPKTRLKRGTYLPFK
jgi:hypothetical protein